MSDNTEEIDSNPKPAYFNMATCTSELNPEKGVSELHLAARDGDLEQVRTLHWLKQNKVIR